MYEFQVTSLTAVLRHSALSYPAVECMPDSATRARLRLAKRNREVRFFGTVEEGVPDGDTLAVDAVVLGTLRCRVRNTMHH